MTVLARARSNIKQEVSCESVASQQGREHGTIVIFIVISRYLATTSEYVTE
jgi:hypothetical protein